MHVDPLVSAVAVLGMAFLLFLAGFEVDVRGLAGADGRVAGRGLLASIVLAGLAAAVLVAVGWPVKAALLVGSALLATSVGLVAPLLKEAGLRAQPTGRLTLAAAAVLGIVVLTGAFAAWVVRAASRRLRIMQAVVAQADGGGQAGIRFTILAVTALALLAVRGLPAIAFLAQLSARQTAASGLLLATSLPFLLIAGEIGESAGILTPSQAGSLALVGLVSVLLLPPLGLRLADTVPVWPSGEQAERGPSRSGRTTSS